MTDATAFRLDTADLAYEFGWEVDQPISTMDEYTKDGATILIQYAADDSITSMTWTRPNRADEVFSEDSVGKNERLRMWLMGRAVQANPAAPQKVKSPAGIEAPGVDAPKLRWSKEGWMNSHTGEIAGDDDPRTPRTVDEEKRKKDGWIFTGSQADTDGGYYRRDLIESTAQSGRPIYIGTWNPDDGPSVELLRGSTDPVYTACVRHNKNNWSPRG